MLPGGTGLLRSRPLPGAHDISAPDWRGGGSLPRPAVSLAHHGVLFLDELPEFSRQSMEALRQPLEDGKVTISRVSASLSLSLLFYAGRRHEPLPLRLLWTSLPFLCLSPPGGPQYLSLYPGLCWTASTCMWRCPRWSTDGWRPASQGRSLCFHKGSG